MPLAEDYNYELFFSSETVSVLTLSLIPNITINIGCFDVKEAIFFLPQCYVYLQFTCIWSILLLVVFQLQLFFLFLSQANNFQLQLAWDDCVSFAIFDYSTIQWREGYQGNRAAPVVFDGSAPINVSPNTTATQVISLTGSCSGRLLNLRRCNQMVQTLPPADVNFFPFFSFGQRCPSSFLLFLFFGRFDSFFFSSTGREFCFYRQSTFFFEQSSVSHCNHVERPISDPLELAQTQTRLQNDA